VKNIIVGVCLTFFINISLVYSDEMLSIVGDFSAKPKNWLDKNGEPKGIMIGLLNEVSARTGITFTYSLYPWKRAYALSELGEGAIIGFSKTTERVKTWDYSDPMYFDELVLVTTKKKAFEFKGLKSLNGRILAIKIGASYGDDFELARKNKYFEVTETSDRQGQMMMLMADRVDVVLVSPGHLALETMIANNDKLKERRDEFVILSPPYKRDPNYLGIPKSMNKSHLLPMINKALADMNNDGSYQKIVDLNIKNVLKEIRNN
jgi:ABC-type amino acid transport substrate-binding protein